MTDKSQEKYVLIGAGGHGAVVAEAIELAEGEVLNFIDHYSEKDNQCGYTIIKNENDISNSELQFIITIGDNTTRKFRALEQKRLYGIVKHPSSTISKRAVLGIGSVVMAGVCINTNVLIGKHCIINTNSTIDHDCSIGDYVHVAPSAGLAGNVEIGEGSYIGLGAFIIQGIKIGKWCIIGAGSVVIRDVPDYSVVAGVPAKFIRINERINEEKDLAIAAPHE